MTTTQVRTRFGNQLEAARGEWFIQGTEQYLFAINSGASSARILSAGDVKRSINATDDAPPRILSPVSGTIIALDPDIPPRHQRVTLSAEGRGLC